MATLKGLYEPNGNEVHLHTNFELAYQQVSGGFG